MKFIETSNPASQNGYHEIDVTYRQIVPESITSVPTLLCKAADIAKLSNAEYIILKENDVDIHCIVATKRYSYIVDNGIYSITVENDNYTGDLTGFLATFKRWYDEGTAQVNQLAQYILNVPEAPELLTGKYFDGTEWKDSE